MPRRRVAEKREILPDPKLGSQIISRFINVVMVDGKKAVAEKIVYGALEKAVEQVGSKVEISQASEEDGDGDGDGGKGGNGDFAAKANAIFNRVLENVRPMVEVRSRRVGGATYQIPVEVRADRSVALAMRWIVQAARGRGEQGMALRLSGEFVDAFTSKGNAVKKRLDTHRMAEANKAFAHFRWN